MLLFSVVLLIFVRSKFSSQQSSPRTRQVSVLEVCLSQTFNESSPGRRGIYNFITGSFKAHWEVAGIDISLSLSLSLSNCFQRDMLRGSNRSFHTPRCRLLRITAHKGNSRAAIVARSASSLARVVVLINNADGRARSRIRLREKLVAREKDHFLTVLISRTAIFSVGFF